jgi:ABC transporter substrate binding protein
VRRRDFIALLGFAANWPFTVRAQGTKIPRIGVLSPSRSEDAISNRVFLKGFVAGLRELGYVEDQNITIERAFSDANADRLRELAVELVKRKIEVIVALSTTAARPAKQATSAIPIVAIAMADPVDDGLVASLARPGGNVTGTTFLGPELVTKRLQLLSEVVPQHSHAGSCGIRMPTVIERWMACSKRPSMRRRSWVCSFNLYRQLARRKSPAHFQRFLATMPMQSVFFPARCCLPSTVGS